MQKKSFIKERILEYADTLGISRRKFYETIGVSRGTLEAKSGITEDILAKIISAYPEISTEWLLLGRGDVCQNKQKIDDISNLTIVGSNVKGNQNTLKHTVNSEGVVENSEIYHEIIKKQINQIDKLIDVINTLSVK